MKKRLLCLLLVLCTLVSMLPATALAVEGDLPAVDLANPYQDVAETAWYYDSVQYVRVNGLFTGVNAREFDPNGYMTRGMFVTVLGRMAGVNPDYYGGNTVFTDVPADAYYAPYVAWASMYGITDGTGEGVFSPNALVDRQQLATFIMRYLEAFGVEYETDYVMTTEEPTDFHRVADWARDAVRWMWQTGLLQGDGAAIDPSARATRAQMATLCTRLDAAVRIWYSEPGVESTRVRIDPLTGEPYDNTVVLGQHSVTFMDGNRLIDTLYTEWSMPLCQIPSVEKSSKAGHVLLGYYLDPEFTVPFHADDAVYYDFYVYAKYREMDSQEQLMPRTFTQLDQAPDLRFRIQRVSEPVPGEANVGSTAAYVTPIDGSDPVKLTATDNGDGTYTLQAEGGFNEGCSYELTLTDGWVFSGKETTIRTASFTIHMDEVENLRMGDEIVYIPDDDGDAATPDMTYTVKGTTESVLSNVLMQALGENEHGVIHNYTGPAFDEGDILCIYDGVDPRIRHSGADALKPAVYVKATSASTAGTVTFSVLGETEQQSLYEIPDNFPLLVTALPDGDTGSFASKQALADLVDEPMYMSVLGEVEGTWEKALTRISSGDYVTMYTSLEQADPEVPGSETAELYFALLTVEEDGSVSYTRVDKQHILDSMDLYAKIAVSGSDLVSDEDLARMERDITRQVEQSGFAEEAAFMLADLATKTDGFRKDAGVQDLLLTDKDGNPLAEDQIELLASGSGFYLDNVDLDVRITNSGNRFDGGVQITIGVNANFTVRAEDGVVHIVLSANFTEEAAIAPEVKGDLVYKEILGIPVPVGVTVTTNIDIYNYTAFDFAAEFSSYDSTNSLISQSSVASDLLDTIRIGEEEGLSEGYYDRVNTLLEEYNRLLTKETDWVQLVEKEIFTKEFFVYGLVIGVETDFVIRADMSIAIGSSLSYEVGKRYSFWFKIGLFEPTAGSDTMDLIDEQFTFQFYVMGKLGVKAGIKAKLYVGIGSGKLANVGIAAEIGPYIKLWGFFIYNYSRTRRANTDQWIHESYMTGGLNLEFGLYFILSFEAEALGLFEYSREFLDEEYPLLRSGDERYYYGFSYRAEEDEAVFMWDENGNSADGISMKLPDSLRNLGYINLRSGVMGEEALPYTDFTVTLSNPYFSFDPSTGYITVNVPEGIRYISCDVTVTYLHGKMPLSNYDITATIPMVWTNLSYDELKEYKTVSVSIGDGNQTETVWTKRVLKGQPFDLPSDAEIKELIDFDELKYSAASGYDPGQSLTGLTVVEDTEYIYRVTPQVYTLQVDNVIVQDSAGNITTETRTFTAPYGGTFNFTSGQNDLSDTGYDGADDQYTRFTNVTTDYEITTKVVDGVLTGEPIDFTKPITGKMAEALATGNVRGTANYIDDSVTAVFTFNGLVWEDVIVITRKGTAPSLAAVDAVLQSQVRIDQQPVGIRDLFPKYSAIDKATHYIVTCVGLSGERAYVRFHKGEVEGYPGHYDPNIPGYHDSDPDYYWPAEDSLKLVGSLVVDIPQPVRRGYTFMGWGTEPYGTGEDGYDQTVPAEGIDLYAQWKANPYVVSLNLQEGNASSAPKKVVVYYDDPFGKCYNYVETSDGYTIGELYSADQKLPRPTKTGYGFLGWSTQSNRKSTTGDNRLLDTSCGALRAMDQTRADYYDVDYTLYAQWRPLTKLGTDIFSFGAPEESTYNGQDQSDKLGYTYTAKTYTIETYDGTMQVTLNENGCTFVEDGETYTYPGFDMGFKKFGRLTNYTKTIINAGQYEAHVTRPADNVFATFDVLYGQYASGGVFNMHKAPRTLSSDNAPTKSSISSMYYGNLIMDRSGITGYAGQGDGTVEFAATTSDEEPSASAYTSGVVYNGNTGSQFYLWVRISEGENYLATNGVRSASKISRTGSAPIALVQSNDDLTYKLRVVTASDEDKTGTDSAVSATIGGTTTDLVESGYNDHESGADHEYTVSIGSLPDSSSTVPVTIKVKQKGSYPAWKLAKLQMVVYRGTQRFASSEFTANQWFLNDKAGDVSEMTFDITGFGRGLAYTSGQSCGGTVDVTSGSDVQIWIDDMMTAQNRGNLNYNVYKRTHAPEFTASFTNNKEFNQYLSWSHEGDDTTGRWVCTVDRADLYSAMLRNNIYSLTLHYGLKGYANKQITFQIP